MKKIFLIFIIISSSIIAKCTNIIIESKDTLQTDKMITHHSKLVDLGIDINSCKCKSCRSGNTPKFKSSSTSTYKKKTPRLKRKNLVIGYGANLFNKTKGHGSVIIGSILFDRIYLGLDMSLYNNFIETRTYLKRHNLYLTLKHTLPAAPLTDPKEIGKLGIGYDFYLNKNISINPTISFYKLEQKESSLRFYFNESGELSGSSSTKTIHEHSGISVSLKLQIHF